MRLVFALTRTWYDSYTDYRTLTEKAWQDVCFINEIKMSEPIAYVVSPINGEFRPHIDNHRNEEKKCKILWWNLERPPRDENHAAHKKDVKELFDKYIDYMIVSDKWYKSYYNEFGDKVIFCPMGIDEVLCPDPWAEGHNKHDFTHMSYVWGRRDILNKLPNCLGNCWKEERRLGLLRTKFMINIHQDQYNLIEPLRFVLAISHGLPIITERINDPYPYEIGNNIMMVDYNQIIETAIRCAQREDYAKFRAMAAATYEKMLHQFSFVKCIKEMADKLGE
jgi:hypothetical protein